MLDKKEIDKTTILKPGQSGVKANRSIKIHS
jgi:hypothetical protein